MFTLQKSLLQGTFWALVNPLDSSFCPTLSTTHLLSLPLLPPVPPSLPPHTYTHASDLLEEMASSFWQPCCFKGRGASPQPQLFTFLLAFSSLVPDQFPQSGAMTITHNRSNPSATCIFVQRFVAHRFKSSRFLRSIHRWIAPGNFSHVVLPPRIFAPGAKLFLASVCWIFVFSGLFLTIFSDRYAIRFSIRLCVKLACYTSHVSNPFQIM